MWSERTSRRIEPEHPLMDAFYLALIVGFFLLTWGLVRLCERV